MKNGFFTERSPTDDPFQFELQIKVVLKQIFSLRLKGYEEHSGQPIGERIRVQAAEVVTCGEFPEDPLCLGHSTITTTMNIYCHVTPTMQRSAVDRFDAYLGNA